MTAILITPPAVPFDITAEQVVAYLLRNGYTEDPPGDYQRIFQKRPYYFPVRVPSRDHFHDHAVIKGAIDRIARRESRPALDVAADIAGPAVGVGGVGCES